MRMMLNLEEVTTSSVRVFLDHDTVARSEPGCPQEIVRVRFIRAPTATGIRFDFSLFRLSIPDESKTLPFGWEEG